MVVYLTWRQAFDAVSILGDYFYELFWCYPENVFYGRALMECPAIFLQYLIQLLIKHIALLSGIHP